MSAADRGWGPGWPDCQYHRWVDLPEVTGKVHEAVRPLFQLLIRDLVAARGGKPMRKDWSWGAACRAIRGRSTPSNHSWGLAVDLEAPVNPMGYYDNVWEHTTMPRNASAIARKYGMRWGGDYSGRKDTMHFEFMGTPAQARRLIRRLATGSPPPPAPNPTPQVVWFDSRDLMDVPVLKKGYGFEDTGDRGRTHWYVMSVQHLCNIRALDMQIAVDGYFGDETERAVIELQRRRNLTVDGIVGPQTWGRLLGNDAPAFA